jgi:signal transduction histidine kinase
VDTSLEAEHYALLLEASAILASSLDLEAVLDALMDQVVRVIGAERGFVMLADEEGQWRIRSARAMDAAVLAGDDYRVSRGVVDRVASAGESVLTSDAMQDARFSRQTSVALGEMKSILCVPLRIEGRVDGVIYADHRMRSGVFGPREKALLEAIARQAAIAMENARLYARLEEVHQTSMEKARRELAATQAELAHSSRLAAVGRMAAGVAHEINNPLGAIALHMTALRDAVGDATSRRRIDIVERAIERCQGIVEKMLGFSRPRPSGEGRMELRGVLEECLALVEHELAAIEVVPDVELEPALWLEGNPDQLSQVFTNLLLNARDALRGTRAGKLSVRASRRKGWAVVEVADNGPGIEPAVRDRIFEPFFTTREVGSGTGLGLWVAHGIVERHRGRLRVDETPGGGATFTVALPCES